MSVSPWDSNGCPRYINADTLFGSSNRLQASRLKPARDDARYQGKVCVWYPYHPLCGKQNLSILRRVGSAEVEYLEIHSADGRQFVPAWMLDADCCAQMTCGLQPAVDLSSLMELADWLRALDL